MPTDCMNGLFTGVERNRWYKRLSKRTLLLCVASGIVAIAIVVIPITIVHKSKAAKGSLITFENIRGGKGNQPENLNSPTTRKNGEDGTEIEENVPTNVEDVNRVKPVSVEPVDVEPVHAVEPVKKEDQVDVTEPTMQERESDPDVRKEIMDKLEKELRNRGVNYFKEGTFRTCIMATRNCSCVNSKTKKVIHLSQNDLATICNIVEFLGKDVRADFEIETYLKLKQHNIKYGTDYCTHREVEDKFYFFRRDAIMIETHNKNPNKMYTLGYGFKAGDVKKGFKRENVGYGDLFEGVKGPFTYTPVDVDKKLSEIPPPIFDWRTHGYVSEVRTQKCGSCWAMAASSAFDTFMSIKEKTNKQYSVQQILDCASKMYGCDGGPIALAFTYIKNNHMCTENEYPLKGVKGACEDKGCSEKKVVKSLKLMDHKTARDHLRTEGPFVISIQNDGRLALYSSGIYDAPCIGSDRHAVAVVGYGEDSKTGKKYWIAKNSWGLNWGEDGYFRILDHVEMNEYGVMISYCHLMEEARGFS